MNTVPGSGKIKVDFYEKEKVDQEKELEISAPI